MLHINLLGKPEIYIDAPPNLHFRTRKAQALLIYLAVTAQSWSRDALATFFWPDASDSRARKNLRDILPTLRRQIGEYLTFEDETIGMNPSGYHRCDAAVFTTVLEGQLQTIPLDTLRNVLALYRGEFLESYVSSKISADFELWALRERERLEQLALTGFTTLCQRQQSAGELEAALATNRRLLQLAPWDEAAHRQQMRLLAQSGQQTAALAHYEICRQILADELDVEPASETMTLHAQIKTGHHFPRQLEKTGEPFPQRNQPTPPAYNLPRQLTSLIGREDDIDSVQHLLEKETIALLTLVGQGGVGKTRLAVAVAQRLQQQAQQLFPDGIWFVPLAGVASGEDATEQIAGTIAQAMELSLSGSDPLAQQLLRALAEQQLLLVLDNFEHLVAEQTFLLELVQRAQQIKVLVTSREQLHLHAEFLYPVVGLPVPAASELVHEQEALLRFDVEPVQPRVDQPSMDLEKFASVNLFVTRVQQRLPELQLTAQDLHSIGHICRLLGGVPLGIELAAQLCVEHGVPILHHLIAEIEQLDPLDAVAQNGRVGFDHLQTAAIDLPARQRSIRAVFIHSWRLLTAAEQDLLCHCAIFRGGFSREAILSVGTGEGSTLLALVMKSLVRRDSDDRYALHELVRQYVIEQLQQKPTLVAAIAQKHATFFIDLLAGQEEQLYQQIEFHRTLQTEHDNIRAAWAWALEQRAIAELERSVVCLFIYLRYAGQVQERITLATQAIEQLQSLPKGEYPRHTLNRLLGYLFVYAASTGMGAGLVEESERWIAAAEDVSEELADHAVLAHLYTALVSQSMSRIEYQRMVTLGKKALYWVKEANLPYLQISIHEAISMGFAHQGKFEESFQAAAELEQVIQIHGYRCVEAAAFFLKSKLYEFQQDWEAALRTAEQGQSLCQAHGHLIGIDNVEGNMIWANLQLGNFAQVRTLANGFGARARRRGLQVERLYSFQTLALAEFGLENWSLSESYFLQALELATILNNPVRQVLIQHQLGKLCMRQAAHEQAAAYFQDALQCTAKIGDLPELQALAQAGLALIDLRQGERARALESVESILGVAKTLTPDGPDHCFVGLVAIEVLSAHQDPRAEAVLDQLYDHIQAQAARIRDSAQRATFLERIQAHRAIVTLWETKKVYEGARY